MLAFYEWLRRHPMLVDGVLAVLVVGLGVGAVPAAGPRVGHRLLALAFVAGMCVPIIARRKHPVRVFSVIIAAGGLEVLLLPRPVGSDLAVLVALYTLAAYRPRRIALPGLLVCLLGSAIAIARWAPGHAIHDWWTLGEVLAVFWGRR